MAKWEFGRLWQTLTYFEIIPLINIWQRIFQSDRVKSQRHINMTILVAGATGGVGKRVTKKLLERGDRG